jgi:type II secretory pathway predicted ATPase ExeA
MYNKFFGFKEKPFKLVPNPEYLFLSKSHEEALGHLTYAVSQGDGFVEITGEVGTGKTTLCRVFLDGLDESVEAAYIFNPKLDALQLLKTINDEFSISSAPDNIKELIDILNVFLIEQKAAGKKIIVLIDEAQNLSKEVLEQLRLLSNLETTQDKLLQIILVGQPELGEMLGSHELRQLGQRIAIHCNLSPLNFQETTEYIRHRIALASHRAGPPFDRTAYRAIFKYSRGIPRLINIACDRALLNAFSHNSFNVTGSIVKEAIKELTKMHDTQPSSNLQSKPAFTVMATILILSLILLLHFNFNAPQDKPVAKDETQETNPTQAEQLIPEQLPESKSPKQDSHIQQTAGNETAIQVPEPAAKQSLSVIPETELVTAEDKKSQLANPDLVSAQEAEARQPIVPEAEPPEQPAAQRAEKENMSEQQTTKPAFEKGSPLADNETVQDADPASVQEQENIMAYSVHVGSFNTLQQADDLVAELRAKNYPSFLYTEADGNGNLVSIVVAGKYLSKDIASKASTKLTNQGYDNFLAKAKSSPSVGPPVSAARPTLTKESKAFQDFLYSLNSRQSRNNAMQEALVLWSPEATVTQDHKKINADRIFFQQVADQHDMMLQPIATDLESIQHLNLPAILAIYLPNHLWPKYLTVVAIDSNQVTFSISGSSASLSIGSEVLHNYWSGEGYLLWKNFAGIHGTISQSSRNESVRALKQLLHDLGNRSIVVNQEFDDNTLQAVKKIQQKYGLREDGKVGPLTKIALYNENKTFNKPSLAKLALK